MPQIFATTVVGSLPKPAWLYQQRPLAGPGTDHHGSGADWNFEGDLLTQAQDDATRLAIYIQESAGIEIISDGEQRRKSYLTYIANRLTGFDYEALAEKWIRDGRRLAQVGRCVGPVSWPGTPGRGGPALLEGRDRSSGQNDAARPDDRSRFHL